MTSGCHLRSQQRIIQTQAIVDVHLRKGELTFAGGVGCDACAEESRIKFK